MYLFISKYIHGRKVGSALMRDAVSPGAGSEPGAEPTPGARLQPQDMVWEFLLWVFV